MKSKLQATIVVRHSLFTVLGSALLAATALFTIAPSVSAQNVTISAADFQRMVYSAHLHTQLALKPELGASLQVLLEMQRRNPNADPAVLAGLSSNALQFYRTNAPCYIRTNGYPDEILAAYLDGLRQLPAHANFFPADLTLFNCFMLNQANYMTNDTPLEMINSAEQRLSSCEGQVIQRQTLVDNCVARAEGNAAFASAMESLLLPEMQVSLADTAAAIIGNTNSPLHGDLTMQTLLALSQSSSDGSVTVSTNQVMNLFTSEMQTIQNTIHTNLAVLAQINQSQPDYLAYLTNQAVVDANVVFQAAVQQGQPAQIACATAAVLVQSQLLPVGSESETAQILSAASAGAKFAIGIGSLCAGKMEGADSFLSGGMDLFDMFGGGQSPQQQLANQISNVQTMVGDLSTNMNYRFDRVDQSLTTIYSTLNSNFSQIQMTLGAQGQQIATLQGSVSDIRSSLVDVQASLGRLEAEIFADFDTQQKTDIIEPINRDLLYQIRHPNIGPISFGEYQTAEGAFYTYAADEANDPISSPTYAPGNLPLLESQFTGWPLDANLNYIQEFLGTLGLSTGGTTPLANPTEWFIAAYAYLQLAGENPMYFRNFGPADLYPIIAAGKNLTNFCGSLTFSPGTSNINWPLYTALENHYVSDLLSFNTQVSNTEYQFGSTHDFNLGSWRQWDLSAPRLTAAATEVLAAPEPPSIILSREPATEVAAGAYHSLALKTDGAVVGWGANSFGQTAIPAWLTGVVGIAGGADYSLALTTNGTVAGWGNDDYGQTNVPAGLTNVAAIASGAAYSLALRADGTVVGWGDNSFGQTNIPTGLTNMAAIAAGADHSLALRADGTVVGWGAGSPGSSGYALSFDGVDDEVTVPNQAVLNAYPLTVSAWIKTTQTNNYSFGIINKYWSGTLIGYQLFLVSGDIHAWYFQTSSNNVWGGGNGLNGGFVADGRWHHVAFVVDAKGGRIFVDGTLTASMPWTGTPGATTTSQPVTLGNYPGTHGSGFYSGLLDEVRIWSAARSQAEIQADMMHRLKGTESGLVAYWKLDEGTGATATNSAVASGSACNGTLAGPTWVSGWGEFGQAAIPFDLSNVTAIAAGAWHSLALLSNGTVVAWGEDDYGQTNVPPGLSNVVAIAAGADHSLALKADGTVAGWGANTCGQTNIPFGLSKVVAIAAGEYHSLALKADGTVVAWGRIYERQCLAPPALTWSGAIAAGEGHGLALQADGTVVGWGENGSGQATGVPSGAPGAVTVAGQPLTNVVAVAAGHEHSLALQADGTVVAWGYNYQGQATIPAGLSNVLAIAGGLYQSMALKADGTVAFWGNLGYGTAQTWSIPASVTNVVAIAASLDYCLALKSEGTVVAWGNDDADQVTNIPTSVTNVVAIAAGDWHSLALLSNGTVVGWGDNSEGEATGVIYGPPGFVTIAGQILTNVVAIAAGDYYSLALKADGTVVGWGNNGYGQTNIPAGLSNVLAIAACGYNNLALKSDGAVVSWGNNALGQNIPSVALTDVVALSAGEDHSLALMAGGTVVDWGQVYSSSMNMPAGLSNVVAIAAGADHSLALLSNGTLVGWGYSGVPAGLSNVVAMAAGDSCSLALEADGSIVGWGNNGYGQATGVTNGAPGVVTIAGQPLSNVVAIAAGGFHSLALQADGTVVGWGDSEYGQATGEPNTNYPFFSAGEVMLGGQALSDVVAIAAGGDHSLALQADGTVVGWGDNEYGETTIPAGLSNVLAIASGHYDNLFLTATNTGASAGSGSLSFITAEIPSRVGTLIADCDTNTIWQMGLPGPLNTDATALSGDKALLAAVLQLGMPYTLERDGVLHGFLYGSQSLMDTSAATYFLQTQVAQLQATPTAPPQPLTVVSPLAYECFVNRLNQCLTNLQATGQPEIPRLVGHTLRLLDLLSDAWAAPTNSPPPALEISSQSNPPSLLLYGEPYMNYTLQYCDSLAVPGWTTTTMTNLQDEQTITPPFSGSAHRFYRTVLPVP